MKRSFSQPILSTDETSWPEKFRAILGSDPLINGVMLAAITVGFFHGWLKIQYRSPAVTFLFDALLAAALVLVFLKQERGQSFFPKSPLVGALQILYAICFFYLFLPLPDAPPLVIGLAAVRGWCFATLMFALGYQLTRSVEQVKGYFYVLILLGLITAIIGIRQDPQEIQRRMMEDAYFAERYQQTYYVTSKGVQLRVFSTFVSSGAFGGTMAYTIIFAVALFSDPRTRKVEKVLLGGAILPMAYGIILTGSRTSLISLIVGLLVVGWFRRNYLNAIFLPAVIALALRIATETTGGSAAERYGTILDVDQVYYRHSIPVLAAWEYMKDNLLGGGLGKSGYSVPSFLAASTGYNKWVDSDGDLGRLMIEMGVIGVAVFIRALWVLLMEVWKSLNSLRNTHLSTIGLSSAACIVMAVISFPSGSPFLGIPMGALVWFFAGTLAKLNDEHQTAQMAAKAALVPSAASAGRGRAPKGIGILQPPGAKPRS